jgi:G3E family GTPase
LINKTDITTDETIASFKWWLAEHIGSKQYIGKTVNGQIDFDFLNIEIAENDIYHNQKPFIHFIAQKQFTLAHDTEKTIEALPRNPSVIPNTISEYKAYGLVFHSSDIFDLEKLLIYLKSIEVLRLKGIFNTNKGYYLFNRINNYFSHTLANKIADSRIELITFNDDVIDFDLFKLKITELICC